MKQYSLLILSIFVCACSINIDTSSRDFPQSIDDKLELDKFTGFIDKPESEFDYIQTYLRPLTRGKKEARDLIDDCAYFKKIKGLTISVDSSIEGVHVPSGTDINLQAERSVLRALSDLATFGAKPLCFFFFNKYS